MCIPLDWDSSNVRILAPWQPQLENTKDLRQQRDKLTALFQSRTLSPHRMAPDGCYATYHYTQRCARRLCTVLVG